MTYNVSSGKLNPLYYTYLIYYYCHYMCYYCYS